MEQPTLDEDQTVHVVGSARKDSNLGASQKQGFGWSLNMPSMWPPGGNYESSSQPLFLHLNVMELGSQYLQEDRQE